MHLRIGVNEWEPFVMSNEENGVTTFKGLSIDLLDIVSQALNFSYSLVVPPDGEWGDNSNGTWSGLIGQLVRKEVDMVFSTLTIFPDRAAATDYSVPYHYTSSTLVVRYSSQAPLSLLPAFFAPFHWQVYAMLLVTFSLCTGMMTYMVSLERRALRHTKTRSFVETSEFMFASFLQEATTIYWTATHVRVFIVSWCFFSLLMTSCYTSKLTSLLVGVPPSPPFTSIRQMVSREDFKWGTTGGSGYLTSLRNSSDAVKREMYQRMMDFSVDDPDVLSLDPEVHLTKVMKENYAFFSDYDLLERWASRHCGFYVLKEKLLGTEMYPVFLQKNSAFTADVNHVLQGLQDAGILSHLRTKWALSQNGCQDNQAAPSAISLAAMQGPCYLALTGVLLAGAALLAERGYRSWNLAHGGQRCGASLEAELDAQQTAGASSPSDRVV